MLNWTKAKERLPNDGQRVLFSPERFKVGVAVYVKNFDNGKSRGSDYFVCEDGITYNWHTHPKADFQWAELVEPLRV